jgi:hypothetical protein
MIANICVPIIFIALAIDIPVLIAYLIGLQFQIEDPNCSADVTNVKRNILATKIVQGFNVAVLIALIIIISVL